MGLERIQSLPAIDTVQLHIVVVGGESASTVSSDGCVGDTVTSILEIDVLDTVEVSASVEDSKESLVVSGSPVVSTMTDDTKQVVESLEIARADLLASCVPVHDTTPSQDMDKVSSGFEASFHDDLFPFAGSKSISSHTADSSRQLAMPQFQRD